MAERAHTALLWPFPEPWRVVQRDAAFEVRDGNDRALVSIRFAAPPASPGARPAHMTPDQARHFANCGNLRT